MIELITKSNKIEVSAPSGETLKEAFDRGYKDGEKDGYENGISDGWSNGYQEGWNSGWNDGLASAEDEIQAAYWEGYGIGYESGYSHGWEVGLEDGKVEGWNEGYQEGWLGGLAEGLSKTRKTQYIEEYFTGSKQYLNYSIDFEPKLIVFVSNDGLTDYETNKPNTNNPIVLKQIIDCKLGFAEGQNYLVRGATVYKYDTKSYAVATGIFTNCVFNQTTGKWDVTFGRADTSTAAIRFVSNGVYPIQILFVGDKEKEEECETKHCDRSLMGSGTSILTIPIPFKPDLITLSTCGYVSGCMSYMDSVGTQRFNIYTTNNVFTRPRFEYEDGKVILTMSSNSNPTVIFKPNSIFFANAIKFTATPKQRTTAEIKALPKESSGETLQYAAFKINENFTTEEWESLIATKPNWTFALV